MYNIYIHMYLIYIITKATTNANKTRLLQFWKIYDVNKTLHNP